MKIAVLVSGGVDSSVALAMLKQKGLDVTAFYLKIWLEDELSYLGQCPWEEDLGYVRRVCDQLQVPLEVISLQKEYHDQVVQYTISEVQSGRTPNPDMLCNSRIKFGLFLQTIGEQFSHVATGHYAQVTQINETVCLAVAPDPVKDQTYFLAHVPHHLFSRVMFPIGHLNKSEVRSLAIAFDLPNKDRKDSQGICFLGKLKFSDFIRHYLGERSGDIIEHETGIRLGFHEGFWYYTIGQRQGLRLAGGPWYVVAKDIVRNLVFVSRNYYTQEKERDHFMVDSVNWLTEINAGTYDWEIKMRHGPHRIPATVYIAENNAVAHITLHERDQGIALGQFAVFYREEQCLGGGVIMKTDCCRG